MILKMITANIKRFLNLGTFILAFQLAFASCFLLGIFWNSNTRSEAFNDSRWYYINRGSPAPWAGISKLSLPVDFPIVKAPFLMSEINGDKFVKIIDLSIFFPLFLKVLLVSYVFAYAFFKAVEKNKDLRKITIYSYTSLVLIDIFSYFFWFSKI